MTFAQRFVLIYLALVGLLFTSTIVFGVVTYQELPSVPVPIEERTCWRGSCTEQLSR